MKKVKAFTSYPLRTCYSLHYCESCQGDIALGQKYYDGGHGRRAHDLCAQADEVEAGSYKYAHTCTGCSHSWRDSSRYYACPWCGEPCSNELEELQLPRRTRGKA